MHVAHHPAVEGSLFDVFYWDPKNGFGFLFDEVDAVVRLVKRCAVRQGVGEVETEIRTVYCGRSEAPFGELASIYGERYPSFGFWDIVKMTGYEMHVRELRSTVR